MAGSPRTFVVLNPKHAASIPECSMIVGNIIDFMDDIGGGAVIVRIAPPRAREKSARWTIEAVENGPEVARRAGTKFNTPDPERSRFTLISVSGRMPLTSRLFPTATQARTAGARV